MAHPDACKDFCTSLFWDLLTKRFCFNGLHMPCVFMVSPGQKFPLTNVEKDGSSKRGVIPTSSIQKNFTSFSNDEGTQVTQQWRQVQPQKVLGCLGLHVDDILSGGKGEEYEKVWGSISERWGFGETELSKDGFIYTGEKHQDHYHNYGKFWPSETTCFVYGDENHRTKNSFSNQTMVSW